MSVIIKMMSFFTSRSFGNCPSTITSEASTMTTDINVNTENEKKDVETQTTMEKEEKDRIIKRSRYIEMNLDESGNDSST